MTIARAPPRIRHMSFARNTAPLNSGARPGAGWPQAGGTLKSGILADLDEAILSLPGQIQRALAANDRIKYCLALLQAARTKADFPNSSPSVLTRERVLAGIDDDRFDRDVGRARLRDDGRYEIRAAEEIVARIIGDVGEMIEPFELIKRDDEARSTRMDAAKRIEVLSGGLQLESPDSIDGAAIDLLTAPGTPARDTVHQLVMDLHKAINALQARYASETLDGAKVFALADDDRVFVSAFMRGLATTAALKFDHPGLDTVAMRHDDRLVIQNDIGTTDAHVLVIHVIEHNVTITYSDVHAERLEFFKRMVGVRSVHWDDTRSRQTPSLHQGSAFYLSIGTFGPADRDGVLAFLAHLGSRLVFLIDWNRARKRLRRFVSKTATLSILDWAADQNVGHRAFLQLGGERLIFDAIEAAAKNALRPGETLADALGKDVAVDYLRFVLRTCTDALRTGASMSLVRDELRAELIGCFRTAEDRLLDILGRHAVLIADSAAQLRDSLMQLGTSGWDAVRAARRLKKWETAADELVTGTREIVARAAEHSAYRRLVEMADDAADDLEEAAFHLSLVQGASVSRGEVVDQLRDLGQLVATASQEYVKCVEIAKQIRRGGDRYDMQAFLTAVDRIVALERESDAAERRVISRSIESAVNFRDLYLVNRVAQDFERSTDSLMHAGLALHDEIMQHAVVAH